MAKNLFTKILVAFVCFVLVINVKAQTTITTETGTTGYTNTNGVSGNSAITFVIENTNIYPVNLNSINIAKGSSLVSPAIFKLWFSSSSLAGALTLPTSSNAEWTLITTSASLTLIDGYGNTIFNNLMFQIPANTQYRFAIESNNGMSYSGTGAGSCTPSTFTQDGITWKVGEAKISSNNVGYAGPLPSPANNPRWFTGSISLSPALPCTAPPIGGAALSDLTNACVNAPFNLSLSAAASQGTGLTYQWDSSSNGTTWFPIAGATTRNVIKTQQSSSFYRCNLTCSGNTVQSTSVQVTSPALIPASNFTINKNIPASATNFQSFAAAINHISCGISGPIKFTVTQGTGPYSEQVTIPAIGGASSTNKIIFKGNQNTLTFDPTVATSRHVLWLNGADHVTIDSLNITAGGTIAGWGVVLTNQADSNRISNCTIDVDKTSPSSTSTNFMGIVINGSNNSTAVSGNNGNANIIENNTINKGSNGFYLYGNTTSTTQNVGNIFRNNIVNDFYGYGVSALYASNGTVISKNDFSRPNRANSTITGGVSLGIGCLGVLVEKNRVHNLFDAQLTGTSQANGIFVSGDARAGFENRIINNLIYNFNGNGTHYGIHNSGGDSMWAYHNTIVLDNASATGLGVGIYQTNAANGINIRNNIVVNTRAGTGAKRCLHFNTTTSTIVSNKNVLFMGTGVGGTDNHIGQFGTTNFTTLANWRTANINAYDQGSLSVNPLFVDVNNANFTPQETSINGIGDNVNVTTDIRDSTRTATPDPGAYEFALPPCTNPVDGGTATTSSNNPCANTSFTLNLTGNSTGTGITYQWQSSPNNANPWTNLGTAVDVALRNQTQTDTMWYRCIVKCNTGTPDTSTVIQVNTTALVSGSFTINNTIQASSTNFQSFNAAINHIGCGINGNVTFTVATGTGPYTEQVTINPISGTSNTSRVIFKGNQNLLTFDPTVATSRHVLWLNGADHVTIDSLNITAGGTVAGWGVVLTNQADSNRISNCTIEVDATSPSSTSTNFMGIVINGSSNGTAVSGNNGNGNIIENNTINRGSNGFYFYGSTTSNTQNVGNIFRNNIVRDFYGYGVSALYASNGTLISKNDFSRPNRPNSTTTGGVSLGTGCLGVLVEKNRVHNLFDAFLTSTSASYGVFVSADATVGFENRIINNAFYAYNGNGIHYGIGNSGGDNMQAYHNTIVMDDANATGAAYGLHQTAAAVGINFRNNIVSITKGGTAAKRAITFVTTTSTIISNKNVLYLNASSGTDNHIGQFGASTATFTTLTNWQSANSNAYDQGSLSVDPLFIDPNNGNFTPQEASINGIGDNVNVTTDIRDTARTATPDPGAFEFSLAGCTNPVDAGAATTSNNDPCANTTFTLNLSGNSSGAGITHQWQSSPNNANPWTNLGTAVNVAVRNQTQTDTMWYRCIVKCNAGTPDTSTVIQVNTAGLISGSFTINNTLPASGTNFQSFAAAVNYVGCGVNGPVTFTVAPGTGPYTEQVTINPISGVSNTNRIIFKGKQNSLNFVPTDATSRHVLWLNGVDHVTIDSLNITAGGTLAGWGVVLTNQADSNRISNCTIDVDANSPNSTSANFMGIVINGSPNGTAVSGNNGNGNIIENNTINKGSNGFYFYGSTSSTTQNVGNIFRNNIVKDFYGYGVLATYASNGTIISKNDFSRPNRANSTTTGGVSLSTGCLGVLVEKNRIHNLFDALLTSTSLTNGIFVSADARTGFENKIINNLIYNLNGNGTHYGIQNSGGDTMWAYHNTIVLDDANATGTGVGIYQTADAKGIDIRNNIISNTRAGAGTKRCLHFNTTTSTIVSNKNVLFMGGSVGGTDNHIGQFGTTNFNTLANWKTANTNAYDQNSLNEDPQFVNTSSGNFTPQNTAIANLGDALGITNDINEVNRSATTPDPGAIEFSFLSSGIDMLAESLLSPAVATSGCYSEAETLSVRIRNNSTSTINFTTNPVTVNVNVTGAVTQMLSTIINTGTLASEATLTVNLPTTLNMSTAGVYNFVGSTSVTGDVNMGNNTFPVPATRTKVALSAATVAASPNIFCGNGGTQPILRGTNIQGANSFQWQQSATSTAGFTNISGAITNPYTVVGALTDTMYYRLIVGCGTSTANSPVDTVFFVNPQILTTVPRYTCGTGSVKLDATATPGTTINWYAAPNGGSPLATGTRFNTPTISSTTTYYAAATTSASVGASPIQITELDLGTDDRFEIQNVSPTSIDVTGWKIYISNSYTDINSVNTSVATLSGSLAPGATISYTDNSAGPNYWGSNILWNPGAFPTFSGWLIIVDNNNAIRDAVFLNWQASNIAGMNVTLGGTAFTIGSQWSGNGIDISSVAATQSVSRKGSLDNNTSADFEIVNLTMGANNIGLTLPMSGFGCESTRTPVVATVDNSPGCVPLPVSLVSFSGKKEGNVNVLNWNTANEVNNKGFYVQRSADGVRFSDIVFVNSKALDNGSSTNSLSYSYTDAKPLAGNNYYRLVQQDKDGKTSLSNIVLIKGAKSDKVELTSVYPNPFTSVLSTIITAPSNTEVKLVITDIAGRVVQQNNVAIKEGTNTVTLNTSSLSVGTYFIQAKCINGCSTLVQKIVKQ